MRKLILALTLFVGCSQKPAPVPEKAATPVKKEAAPPPEKTNPAPAADAAGQASAGAATKANPSPEGVIKFDVPTAWIQQKPSNNMRKAQYGIPDKEQEAANGSMTLFFFGPSRNRMDEIIKRWRGQVSGGVGDPETFQGNTKVTLLDLHGDYEGDFGGQPIHNARMFAAVVETEDGPWYFKVTGPAATIGDWREEFISLLKTAHK